MRESRAKEVKMWTILKEILTYLIYLAVICTLGYDNRDVNAFRAKNQIHNMFAMQPRLYKVSFHYLLIIKYNFNNFDNLYPL